MDFFSTALRLKHKLFEIYDHSCKCKPKDRKEPMNPDDFYRPTLHAYKHLDNRTFADKFCPYNN